MNEGVTALNLLKSVKKIKLGKELERVCKHRVLAQITDLRLDSIIKDGTIAWHRVANAVPAIIGRSDV